MTGEICPLLRGATCYQLPRLAGPDPLVQEMHVVVTCIRIEEPVRLKLRAKRVARCKKRSNMPGDLTPIHGRGMMRHKPKPRGEHEAPKEGIPVKRTLCKIPALLLPQSPA